MFKMKPETKINLTLPRKLWGRIKGIATEEGVTVHVVATRLLTEGLKKEGAGQ